MVIQYVVSYIGFELLLLLVTVSLNVSPTSLTVTVYIGDAAGSVTVGASNGTSYLAVDGSYI